LLRAFVSPAPISRSVALGTAERLSAAFQLVSSLEHLRTPDQIAKGGFNNWQINRDAYVHRWPKLTRALDSLAAPKTTQAIHAARVAAALALIAPTPTKVRAAANGFLTLSTAALYPRIHMGTDGSDQAALLVQSAATVARLGGRNTRVADAALWFMGLQATLSYAASGWTKLTSPTWRSGEALTGILRTRSYGHPKVYELLRKYPQARDTMAAGVLAMESLFPLVYAAKGRLGPVFVGSAAAFHLANGHVMGLGRFIPSFLAMHPAVLYTTGPKEQQHKDGTVERRDDLVPAIAGSAAAVALAAAQVLKQRRRRAVRAGRRDELRFTATSGNDLGYRLVGPGSATGPVVAVEAGLMSTAEHWEWIASALGEGHTVLTYNRAGYGSSVYRATWQYRLRDSVRDFVELVDHAVPDRPLFLVGHSLGGYLALLAGQRLEPRLAGYAFIDSSHPQMLRRSERQARGEVALIAGTKLVPESLSLGLGPLMQRPPWVDQLPEPIRRLALAQYRDSSTWAAAAREWTAVHRHFKEFEGDLPPITAPALVVTAAHVALQDPVHLELQAEMAAAAPWGAHHIIDDAAHNDLVMHRRYAGKVTDLIEDFLNRLHSSEESVEGRAR
jgi:pimeloyl-ACP methyl ester carboxylesterase